MVVLCVLINANGVLALDPHSATLSPKRIHPLDCRAQGTSEAGGPSSRHQLQRVRRRGVVEDRGQDAVGDAGRRGQGGLRRSEARGPSGK
jgi:hypothetical protein